MKKSVSVSKEEKEQVEECVEILMEPEQPTQPEQPVEEGSREMERQESEVEGKVELTRTGNSNQPDEVEQQQTDEHNNLKNELKDFVEGTVLQELERSLQERPPTCTDTVQLLRVQIGRLQDAWKHTLNSNASEDEEEEPREALEEAFKEFSELLFRFPARAREESAKSILYPYPFFSSDTQVFAWPIVNSQPRNILFITDLLVDLRRPPLVNSRARINLMMKNLISAYKDQHFLVCFYWKHKEMDVRLFGSPKCETLARDAIQALRQFVCFRIIRAPGYELTGPIGLIDSCLEALSKKKRSSSTDESSEQSAPSNTATTTITPPGYSAMATAVQGTPRNPYASTCVHFVSTFIFYRVLYEKELLHHA